MNAHHSIFPDDTPQTDLRELCDAWDREAQEAVRAAEEERQAEARLRAFADPIERILFPSLVGLIVFLSLISLIAQIAKRIAL